MLRGGGSGLSAGNTQPVLFATFGDSLADWLSITSFDARSIAAAAGSVSLLAGRMGPNILSASGGRCVPVANCGIGGTQTSTMITRDTSAASSTRKAIADAYNCGATQLIMSAGTNDIIQNVTAASTAGQITTILNTYYTNLTTLLKRASGLFQNVLLTELMTIDYAADAARNYAAINGLSAADVAAMKPVFDTARAYVAANIVPLFSNVSIIPNYSTLCDTVNKTFLTGVTTDGLHPNAEGGFKQAVVIASMLQSNAKYPSNALTYAPLPVGAQANTGYGQTDPSLSIVAGGYASGFSSTTSGIGTVSVTPSVVEINNVKYQQYLYTPLTFNGTARVLAPSGWCVAMPTFQVPIYGATPIEKVNNGDLVRYEFDLTIDDGAGGPALNVLSFGCDINFGYNGTFFTTKPIEENATDIYLHTPTVAVKQKVVSLPLEMPRGSLAMTNVFAQIYIIAGGATTQFRVLVNNVRVVRIPAPVGKPSVQLSTPTTGATVAFDSNKEQFGILDITPAAGLAALTITLPATITGVVDRERTISTTQAVTTLTVNGATTIYNAPASLAAGDCITFREIAPNVWAKR